MAVTRKNADLAAAFGELLGNENVVTSAVPEVDESRPSLLVTPSSHEEVRESLKLCAESKAAVVPAGRLSWLDCGNPVTRADVIISLQKMNRVIDYSPADLTATVQAGVGIDQLNQLAAESRQWLPLDPPGSGEDTLGALAACAVGGSLRYGFGTIRDYALGLKLVHADGGESKSGGRVVKNVAGYDMTKLYVGSYGTLAIITELTLKLRPMPERQATLAITPRTGASLFDLAAQVLRSELRPASVYLVDGNFDGLTRISTLLIRFVENSEAVDYQIQRVVGMMNDGFEFELLPDGAAAATWRAVANIDESEEIVVRCSVPPSNTRTMFEEMNSCGRRTADVALGIVRGLVRSEGVASAIASLRAQAAQAAGHLFIEKAPASIRREVDAWGDPGPAGRLMIAVKDKLDPERLMNPGKFIRGI